MRFNKSTILINPLYFLFLFLLILAFNLYHFSVVDTSQMRASLFFLIYAIGQTLFEVSLIYYLTEYFSLRMGQWVRVISVVFSFLLLIVHGIDVFLTQFMDMSIWYIVPMLLDESLENFIEVLVLTGIPLSQWALFFLAVGIVLPACALGFYRFCEKLQARAQIYISRSHLGIFCLMIPLGLFVFDLTWSPKIEKVEHYKMAKLLPWKQTFLNYEPDLIDLPGEMRHLPQKEQMHLALEHLNSPEEKLPNIYLFVSESLREDFITEKIAPRSAQFSHDCLSFSSSFSNANATHPSWYTIFHSQLPLHWATAQKDPDYHGSFPLKVLKKMGYKIHLLSTSQLRYYQMGRLIFGEDYALTSTAQVADPMSEMKAFESDRMITHRLLEMLQREENRKGQLFVIFYDSTHFNYSFPEDQPLPFQPIAEEKTEWNIAAAVARLEGIKNRYRNAIHFVDGLFGQIVDYLKEQELYDEALIGFTGDHGEEFFEEGQLFHASHLSDVQTRVPLYLKLGKSPLEPQTSLISHIDIFPTFLDHLNAGEEVLGILGGESVLRQRKWAFVLAARYNGARDPYEFFLHTGKDKAIFRLVDPRRLEVVSVTSPLKQSSSQQSKRFKAALQSLCSEISK